jgi:hypothetical protein
MEWPMLWRLGATNILTILMNTDMKKLIGILSTICVLFTISSCDPERECTEPRCIYSDVNAVIPGYLSGNLDSIINVGDTIRFYMKVPEILGTNYGNIERVKIRQNSFFGIRRSGGGDTLIGGAFPRYIELPRIDVKYSLLSDKVSVTWDYNTGEYECLFIPNNKGKFIISAIGGRLEVDAKDGKSWLINPIISIDAPRYYGLYKSWLDSSLHEDAMKFLSTEKAWYCFEVR